VVMETTPACLRSAPARPRPWNEGRKARLMIRSRSPHLASADPTLRQAKASATSVRIRRLDGVLAVADDLTRAL
jgi:hypothetical protein